ncbi:MAG: hypothetical protein J0H91_14465 [Rhodospirillales bacterium]|nr:hypothetical protein [Rhodospirillales bacterium]
MLVALALKMATTAGVVVLACLVVERTGPVVGAMIATLPGSAGPAYAFLAMEHGPGFIADSALASMAALAATSVFVTVYAWLARDHGLAASIGAAVLAWLAVAAGLRALALGLPAAATLNLALFLAGQFLVRDWRRAPLAPRRPPSRWDIPIRAAAAMALVALVLVIGRLLGPRAAGLAALAPVVMTSLGILLYPRLGGAGAAAVLANTLPGMLGNSVAVAVLHLTAVPLGSTPALLLALAICVAWNGAITAWQRWR